MIDRHHHRRFRLTRHLPLVLWKDLTPRVGKKREKRRWLPTFGVERHSRRRSLGSRMRRAPNVAWVQRLRVVDFHFSSWPKHSSFSRKVDCGEVRSSSSRRAALA
ncbi:hypothetical protein NL676_036777 [Syzygium grande]|nr:hypothetical protein NL676_036777 [Syzygium grande]